MFTDELRRNVWDRIRQQDLRAFTDRLNPEIFAQAAQRAGVTLGRGPLQLANLVWLGLASALHRGKNFADVLMLVLKLVGDTPGWESSPLAVACRTSRRATGRGWRGPGGRRSKHDPRPTDPQQLSEEAFVQARRRMPAFFWSMVLFLLVERFEAAHRDLLYGGRFRLLADYLAGYRLHGPGLSFQHCGDLGNQPASPLPPGVGRLGHPQPSGANPGSGLVPLALGNRDHLHGTEGASRPGREPAQSHPGRDRLRSGRSPVALPPGALADGRGRRQVQPGTAAAQFPECLAGIAGHEPDAVDRQPATRILCARTAFAGPHCRTSGALASWTTLSSTR